jgi:hypothetical protein
MCAECYGGIDVGLRFAAAEMGLPTSELSDYYRGTWLAISPFFLANKIIKINTILHTGKWQHVRHALTKGKSTTDAIQVS